MGEGEEEGEEKKEKENPAFLAMKPYYKQLFKALEDLKLKDQNDTNL